MVGSSTMSTDDSSFREKVEELKKYLGNGKSVLVFVHDNPDPDCLASAFGMEVLLKHWGIKTVQITFGGFIGRAENRAMIQHLHINAMPFALIDFSDYEKIISVDSFPGDGNISLEHARQIDAVVDHHPRTTPHSPMIFQDIRTDVGATSTIIYHYLAQEQCEISVDLATALFYGIKTDTKQLSRNASPADLHAYKALFDILDHKVLAQIEYPERNLEYFEVLHRSTHNMTIYNEIIGYTHIGNVPTPDYVAEIADLMHSAQSLEWMICSGIFKGHFYFSLRSKTEVSAGTTARSVAQVLGGSGGGHVNMAAGKVPYDPESTEQLFLTTLFSSLHIVSPLGRPFLQKEDA